LRSSPPAAPLPPASSFRVNLRVWRYSTNTLCRGIMASPPACAARTARLYGLPAIPAVARPSTTAPRSTNWNATCDPSPNTLVRRASRSSRSPTRRRPNRSSRECVSAPPTSPPSPPCWSVTWPTHRTRTSRCSLRGAAASASARGRQSNCWPARVFRPAWRTGSSSRTGHAIFRFGPGWKFTTRGNGCPSTHVTAASGIHPIFWSGGTATRSRWR